MFIFTEKEADSPGQIRYMALLLDICSEESGREIRTLFGLLLTRLGLRGSDNDNEWTVRDVCRGRAMPTMSRSF